MEVPLTKAPISPIIQWMDHGPAGGMIAVERIMPRAGYDFGYFIEDQVLIGQTVPMIGACASLSIRGSAEPVDFQVDNASDLDPVRSFVQTNPGLVWSLRIMSPNGLGSTYSRSNVEQHRIGFQWQAVRRNLGQMAALQIVALHRYDLGATAEQIQSRLEGMRHSFTGEFLTAAEARL